MDRSLTIAISFALAAASHAAVILDNGDIEFATNFNASLVGTDTNPWLLTLRDTSFLREYAGVRAGFPDVEQAYLQAGETSLLEIPDDPAFEFLGAASSSIYILPEATDEDLLTPGLTTEPRPANNWQGVGVSASFLVTGVPTGLFTGNSISLTLASFSGPGDFFLFRLDGFGNPLIAFRTDDGIDASDTRSINAATHTHYNWAFTAPGDYILGLRASGTLNNGNQFVQSDITTFRVHIIPEPGTTLLLSLATTPLLLRRRRHRV